MGICPYILTNHVSSFCLGYVEVIPIINEDTGGYQMIWVSWNLYNRMEIVFFFCISKCMYLVKDTRLHLPLFQIIFLLRET